MNRWFTFLHFVLTFPYRDLSQCSVPVSFSVLVQGVQLSVVQYVFVVVLVVPVGPAALAGREEVALPSMLGRGGAGGGAEGQLAGGAGEGGHHVPAGGRE